MRSDNITGYEMAWFRRHLIKLVGINQMTIILHLLNTGKVASLPNCRNN